MEVLKPTNEPNMGIRHDASVAKEKRLEEVTRPATAKKVQQEQETKKEEKKKKKSKQPAKKKQKVNKADLANTEAVEQDDEVAEGINWSDDESESSNEDSD